jgi:hypothetical protein
MVRESICAILGELEDILIDLKDDNDDNITMSRSSREALHIYAINRIHDIAKMVHFEMVPKDFRRN